MYYKGSLNGISIKELKKLDKEKKLFSERKEYLEKKYEIVLPYYHHFTDEIYNYNINILSHEINIFNFLEFDGIYLLSSSDIVREKNISTSMKKYDEALINVATKRHANFDIALSTTSKGNNTSYINTDTVITANDYSNEQYGEYLKAYERARMVLKRELKILQNRLDESEEESSKITEEETKYNKRSLNQLMSLLSDLKQDTKIVKEAFQGLTKHAIKDEKIGYIGKLSTLSDNIDYTNPKHISAILKYVNLNQAIEPNKEITLIAYDIKKAKDKLYEEGTLNDNDLSLIALIQNSGLTFEEIAKELSVSRKTVYNRFNSIVTKVCLYNKSKEGR